MNSRNEILKTIDTITAPGKMSQQEALDWLEKLVADIEGSIDALREEIGE